MAELVPARTVAEKLAVSVDLVRDLARRGVIPSIVLTPRVRRYDLEQVRAALERGQAREPAGAVRADAGAATDPVE
jgi:hypothetical protein